MVVAGPSPQHYNPALTPVLGLLRELGDRPSVHDLAISKPDLRLSVHRRPEEAGHA
jgi:oxaloacetate decarboxylase (Na+ extruding) subunit alpha